MGSKKNPIWRVVVADQRSPRDGRSIENLGYYNPQTQPSTIVIDRERMDYWLERGAQPTGTVKKLLRAPNTEVAPAPAPVEEATASVAEAEAEAPADVAAASEPETAAAPEAAARGRGRPRGGGRARRRGGTRAAETASEPDPEAPPADEAPAEADAGSKPDPEAPASESA